LNVGCRFKVHISENRRSGATVLYPRDLQRLDAGGGVSGRVRDSIPVKFQVHSFQCRDTNEVRMKFGSYGSYIFGSYVNILLTRIDNVTKKKELIALLWCLFYRPRSEVACTLVVY